MKSYLIMKLFEVLIRELANHAPALLVSFTEHILDWVKGHVLGSASELDDKTILPLYKMVREDLDISDDQPEPSGDGGASLIDQCQQPK